jgi:hypothetical protein
LPRKNGSPLAALDGLQVSGAALHSTDDNLPGVAAHETIPAHDVIQHACAGRGPGSRCVDRPRRPARLARSAYERTIRSWGCIFGSRCDLDTAWKSLSEENGREVTRSSPNGRRTTARCRVARPACPDPRRSTRSLSRPVQPQESRSIPRLRPSREPKAGAYLFANLQAILSFRSNGAIGRRGGARTTIC